MCGDKTINMSVLFLPLGTLTLFGTQGPSGEKIMRQFMVVKSSNSPLYVKIMF